MLKNELTNKSVENDDNTQAVRRNKDLLRMDLLLQILVTATENAT